LTAVTLGVVVAAAVPIVSWIGTSGHGAAPMYYPPAGRTPVDILKERFARGEIDKDEFEERCRLLGN